MTRSSQIGSRRKHKWYRDWAKAVLITAVVMGTLWILLLKAPWFFWNNDTLGFVVFFALAFPGAVVVIPAAAVNIHNYWAGWWVVGAILNWLFYSQLVYWFLRFRWRKREAGLPPAEPEEYSYADRWGKTKPTDCSY